MSDVAEPTTMVAQPILGSSVRPPGGGPETSDPEAIQDSTWEARYPSAFTEIVHSHLYAAFYVLSRKIRAKQEAGGGEWVAGVAYLPGAVVRYDGVLWRHRSSSTTLSTNDNGPKKSNSVWDYLAVRRLKIGMLVAKFHWMRDLSEIHPGTVWEDVTASLGYADRVLWGEDDDTPWTMNTATKQFPAGYGDWTVPDISGNFPGISPEGAASGAFSGIFSEVGAQNSARNMRLFEWMRQPLMRREATPEAYAALYSASTRTTTRATTWNAWDGIRLTYPPQQSGNPLLSVRVLGIAGHEVDINAALSLHSNYNGHTGGAAAGLLPIRQPVKIERLTRFV